MAERLCESFLPFFFKLLNNCNKTFPILSLKTNISDWPALEHNSGNSAITDITAPINWQVSSVIFINLTGAWNPVVCAAGFKAGILLDRTHRHTSMVANTIDCPGVIFPSSLPSPPGGSTSADVCFSNMDSEITDISSVNTTGDTLKNIFSYDSMVGNTTDCPRIDYKSFPPSTPGGFAVYCPNQQPWSCRDGHFAWVGLDLSIWSVHCT